MAIIQSPKASSCRSISESRFIIQSPKASSCRSISESRLTSLHTPLIFPLVQDVYFGLGFIQNSDVFVIKKESIPGLTLQANNTSESLLVGLLALWLTNTKNNNLLSVVVSPWGITI